MSIELIIFSTILVFSVVAHFFFWKDSKKRYDEYMKRVEALNERIEQLEASDNEIDKMLDEAENAMGRIDEGIEDLRSGRFMRKEKPTFDN